MADVTAKGGGEHASGGSSGGASSLMCGPEPDYQSHAPGPTGPGGPIDHGAASAAFGHYADVPTHSELPKITLGKPPAKPAAPPAKTPPKAPPAPKLPPLPKMSKAEEEKFFTPPDLYDKLQGKSPAERDAIVHDYERKQSMSGKQYKDTQGMTDEQAAAHIRNQELKKTLPPELQPKWDTMTPDEQTKALAQLEAKMRADAKPPTQAPKPSQ